MGINWHFVKGFVAGVVVCVGYWFYLFVMELAMRTRHIEDFLSNRG